MKYDNPDLFNEVVKLEEHLNNKRGVFWPSPDYVFLHRQRNKLDLAVANQRQFPGFNEDDSGYCFGSCDT